MLHLAVTIFWYGEKSYMHFSTLAVEYLYLFRDNTAKYMRDCKIASLNI